MPDNIELDKPFTIERGGRKATYKIIKRKEKDNYLDVEYDVYNLVSNHRFIDYNYPARDEDHIINGSTTMEGAYEKACWHT